VAISIEQQNTSADPCRSLHALARGISEQEHMLAVSLLLGFPYADVADMGSGFIVVADGTRTNSITAAGRTLGNALIEEKDHCIGEMKSIASVLPDIIDAQKPVLLLDMGDNIGGGSPGDSAYLLDAIERDGRFRSFSCIYDPEAVAKASLYNINETFELTFGNRQPSGVPESCHSIVTLLRKSDGRFTEHKPRHGGQVNFDMGRIVVLRTGGGNIVMLNSLRVPPFSLSQVTSFDIAPQDFDIIIAKGVNAPIAAYSVVCPTIIQVNTPGVTQADMTLFPFHKRRKPLFPFEKNIA
jgi:microcystin degradation protein MlrC